LTCRAPISLEQDADRTLVDYTPNHAEDRVSEAEFDQLSESRPKREREGVLCILVHHQPSEKQKPRQSADELGDGLRYDDVARGSDQCSHSNS
jgi:hypothetical protein